MKLVDDVSQTFGKASVLITTAAGAAAGLYEVLPELQAHLPDNIMLWAAPIIILCRFIKFRE